MISHELFLCLCDMMTKNESCNNITFPELFQFSEYITKSNIRPLYTIGRQMLQNFNIVLDSEQGKLVNNSIRQHYFILQCNSLQDIQLIHKQLTSKNNCHLESIWAEMKQTTLQKTIQDISLSISTITDYLENQKNHGPLLALGCIMETLGHNSSALISNPAFAITINQYINCFAI
jgi:hypothetical protein